MKLHNLFFNFRNILLCFCVFFISFSVMPNTAQANFLVVSDDASNIYVAESNGDGSFGTLTQIDYLGGNYSRGIAVNDFDNDGDLDFVAGRGVSGTGYYYLFLNDGSNNFTKTAMIGTQSNANSYAMDMASADFNNDGNMDFSANSNYSITGIWLGDGKGGFTKTELNWGAYGRGMDTADFNHDGYVDIVRGRNSSGYIDVYWGDGTGAFPTSTYLGDVGSDPYGVVAGDFDNDGHPDVFANYGSNGDTYFIKNNGDGTFQAPVYEASLDLGTYGGFDAFDFNGDGNLDVIIVNNTGRKVYYYPGNGDGTFGAAADLGGTISNVFGISTPPLPGPAGRPVAVIAPAAPAPIVEGGTVDFNGSGSSDSDGTIDTWAWTFGDGNIDTVEDPAPHAFAAEGTYATNLLVTDNAGKSGRATTTVVVQGDVPAIDITPVNFGELDADHGMWNLNLDASDYASDTEGVVSYQWEFSDGLSENFEDGDAVGWQVYAGTWEIEDTSPITGSFSYRQTDTGLDRTWVLFDQIFDTDLIIEVDVHLTAGGGEEAQILFRAQDQDNNYEFILRGRGNNDVLLYRRVSGATTNIFEYNLPPTADFSGPSYPIDLGHTYAVKIVLTDSLIQFYLDGVFLFAIHDATFMDGRVGFSTYDTHTVFDNLVVTPVAKGQTVTRRFFPGLTNVQLTATDAAGQSASGTVPVTVEPGAPPVADAGGGYAAGEAAALAGGWTFALDGSGSTDDVEIQKYEWDLGTDTLDGTRINDGKWTYNGNVSQNDEIIVSNPGTGWDHYIFSKDNYSRAAGMAFEAKVKVDSTNTMIGWKNTSSNGEYTQYPYAIYFYSANIYIYEDGASRGDTGFNVSYGIWYDIRIELKETQGARYYYRLSGDPDWILVYDSNHSSATEFKRGVDVYRGTFRMDNVREIAAGVNPSYRVYGLGVHPVSLTVYDRAGQSHTDTTTATTSGSGIPVANGGADLLLSESDASAGQWSVNFDASASTDDLGIYTYEWDWNYDGSTFIPSGDTGATVSHVWVTPGAYTVAVRVTDHALQTHIDTIDVNISLGTPPTADAGGAYAADEATGNAFEGAWTVTLDGTGSSDDTEVDRYFWNLGTEPFDGTRFDGGKWFTNGGVTQDDAVAVTGANSWDNRYIVSRGTVPRSVEQVFETRFKSVGNGQCMFGFKNSNSTNFNYTQFPYEFYIYNNNIYIYENANSRGDTGFNVTSNTWYDFKIELTHTGAVYSYKLTTTADWTVVYTSSYLTGDIDLRKGMVVHSGTYWLDDIPQTAGGVTPTVYLSGLGSHTITLTAYDRVGQTDTDSSSITLTGNALPFPDAGADQSLGETDASQGKWTANFSGTATDDGPNGVYFVDWDFNYDGSTFNPSGETVLTVSHVFDAIGVYTVAMRVTDHALQSSIDTLTLTISGGGVPTANAGSEVTTEGELWVRFNGTGSTDDLRIRKYEWDFGDGVKGTGPTPAHVYHTPGSYTATLTVWDEANQTGTDTVPVNVLTAGEALPPTANAGGPYNAGAGGPPAYLNASSSSDDYGIVKYFWDVDNAVDTDGDGDYTNDVDAVGRKPFYTYAAAGTYTVTLTVEDGAGQQATATGTVNVAANLAPDVICVPWRGSDPTIPHEAIQGENTRLKGIVRDAGALEYRWNPGDGSGWGAWTIVSTPYAIELNHTYTGVVGTPYTATLEVRDSAGLVGQDFYYLVIAPNNYDTRTNIAIDNGLWYIHKLQIRPAGYWQYSSYELASTASSLQAFVINTHIQDGDHQEDPYVETVTTGYTYLFNRLRTLTTGVQTAGNPDTNGNGLGIEIDEGNPIYQGGPTMDAIASTNTPGAVVYDGQAGIKDRYYIDILRDMADAFAWGQMDSSNYRGGWRYNWNSQADNSACQWAAIGMIGAEDNFGIWVPDFVKNENNDYWLRYSYDGAGFGYATPGNTTAGTPSGMVQLAFDEVYTSDSRWQSAEDYIATNWGAGRWAGTFYYATYAMAKALRLAQPQPVVTFGATGLDWYNDPDSGLRKYLVDNQNAADGYWQASGHAGGNDRDLSTPWVVIMLTPALFTQPPEADAGDDIIWAFDQPLKFDASGSRHLDPLHNIVLYEWDFDGDGTYDFSTINPSDPDAKFVYPDPNPSTDGDLPQVFTARLRITDDNDPVQTDIDTREVTVAEPPHAPFADAGGPYTVTAGIPFPLDGSGSNDIDPGDSITQYDWDLDNDGVFFDDVDNTSGSPTVSWTYNTPGVYNVALKVWDNGAYNPIGCTIGVDCDPLESLPNFTTVTVVENQAPIADANGPYVVDEGTTLILDGTGSTDPNGDPLSYAWDLDGDGNTDDSTASQPTWTFMEDGVYTVTLTVSDSLLEDTATAQVTVNDLSPTAGFSWSPAPQDEGLAVNFTDTSVSSPDTIVSWAWDFGGLATSSEQNPSYVFDTNGSYTVTLTVTDEDGSVDTVSHVVTIADGAPTAEFTWTPDPQKESLAVNFTDTSVSNPDTISSWAWDFGGLATSNEQNPSYVFDTNGSYTVTLAVTDEDGSVGTVSHVVTITDGVPTAGFTWSPEPQVENSPVLFTDTSTSPQDPIVSWAWDFDGLAASTEQNPSYTFSDSGVYTVSLTVTDTDGSTSTVLHDVTIGALDGPTAAFTWTPEPQNEGAAVAFTDQSIFSADAIVAWSWNFAGLGTSSDQHPTHTFMDNGSYPVTLIVTDSEGRTGSVVHTVTINNVLPAVDAGPDQTIDEGDTSAFTGSFTDPGTDTHTYEWDFGDGSLPVTGSLTPTHVYADNGSYTVTLTVTDDDGGVGSDTLVVTVEDGGPPLTICGDLDHDGDVDGSDMMILRGALNSCSGDARFVSEADYDQDGCVTFNDYRLWYTCYQEFIAP